MSNPQWAADIEIDIALATFLIASQFPQLRSLGVEPLGIGWDNAAFLVNGKIVFRFPRRQIATALIEREIAILPLLRARLPLAIPAPLYVGTPQAEYPWHFAGYDLIEGETACTADFSNVQRAGMTVPLAAFLRALHDSGAAQLAKRGLQPDTIGSFDHEKWRTMTAQRESMLNESGIINTGSAFTQWLQDNPPAPATANELRVVHGDLYARHIIVNSPAKPVGVIDWG